MSDDIGSADHLRWTHGSAVRGLRPPTDLRSVRPPADLATLGPPPAELASLANSLPSRTTDRPSPPTTATNHRPTTLPPPPTDRPPRSTYDTGAALRPTTYDQPTAKLLSDRRPADRPTDEDNRLNGQTTLAVWRGSIAERLGLLAKVQDKMAVRLIDNSQSVRFQERP